MEKYLIYTDGGSRGNPGPSALGVVIEDSDLGKKEYSEYLGEKTNNEAEYEAVIFALRKLKSLIGSDKAKTSKVEVVVDSELLAKQLNGEYKIKDEKIKSFFILIWNLKIDFKEIIFKYVTRDKNLRADALVNQALDREESKLDL